MRGANDTGRPTPVCCAGRVITLQSAASPNSVAARLAARQRAQARAAPCARPEDNMTAISRPKSLTAKEWRAKKGFFTTMVTDSTKIGKALDTLDDKWKAV